MSTPFHFISITSIVFLFIFLWNMTPPPHPHLPKKSVHTFFFNLKQEVFFSTNKSFYIIHVRLLQGPSSTSTFSLQCFYFTRKPFFFSLNKNLNHFLLPVFEKGGKNLSKNTEHNFQGDIFKWLHSTNSLKNQKLLI